MNFLVGAAFCRGEKPQRHARAQAAGALRSLGAELGYAEGTAVEGDSDVSIRTRFERDMLQKPHRKTSW
ncbi:MAG: hypothetical protein WBD33_02185 [Xanthobacteraceae bacterium]